MKHLNHLVDRSYWPLVVSTILYSFIISIVLILQGYNKGNTLMLMSLVILVISISLWTKDIIRESRYIGFHTTIVKNGILLAISLFIISEICLFMGIFWSYLHSEYNSNIMQQTYWPSLGIDKINPFELPLLNTFLLLSAGFAITWSHHNVIISTSNINKSIIGLLIGIIMTIIFTLLQILEFYTCSFDLSDSVYGSTFFMATTFHGFHVLVGTLFLIISLIRLRFNYLTNKHHTGLLFSLWYFHFTDVVWIILYILIYLI